MRTSLILICVLMSGYASAQVYRSVDKDGNVIFSDQATKGAKEVEIKELEIVKSLDPASVPASQPAKQELDKLYTGLEITSPQNDLAIRDNEGNVTVTVALTPNLRAGHNLVLYLDGKKQSSGKTSTLRMQQIDRGTHQLRVAVVDAEDREQIGSATVTFHLLRFSAANPSIAKPPKK